MCCPVTHSGRFGCTSGACLLWAGGLALPASSAVPLNGCVDLDRLFLDHFPRRVPLERCSGSYRLSRAQCPRSHTVSSSVQTVCVCMYLNLVHYTALVPSSRECHPDTTQRVSLSIGALRTLPETFVVCFWNV